MTPADSRIWQQLETFGHLTILSEGAARRVVRYAATSGGEDDGAGPSIIGKFYRDDEGMRTMRIMEALRVALERCPSAVLRVPRALGYDAKRRLLLQEAVRGARFDTLLAGPNARGALYLAGRALSALHGLSAAVGAARRLRHHIDDLIQPHPSRLAQQVPRLAPRVDRIVRALVGAEARFWPCGPDMPIHRDVHPRQLFVEEERVSLIDWDLCARGDGALDLGNFVAYLRARRLVQDDAIDCLMRGYAESGRADVLERVPLYEALTYLRLACKRFRLGKAGWREECDELITRAELSLASGS
jgi:aminoglycoside phosphotransferase (APT) family kinase protein